MALRADRVRVGALEPRPFLTTWRLFQSDGAHGKYVEWVFRWIVPEKRPNRKVTHYLHLQTLPPRREALK